MTIDNDKDEQRILREMSRIDNFVVDIGIFGGTKTSVKTQSVKLRGKKISVKSKQSTGIRIAEYATMNEFGTENIPQRSFIRSTMDENWGYYWSLSTKEVNRILTGRQRAKGLYVKMGIKIKGDIQRKITSLRTPPNHPMTIKAKGSSNPLIDSGSMRMAIAYKVRNKLEAASDDTIVNASFGSFRR